MKERGNVLGLLTAGFVILVLITIWKHFAVAMGYAWYIAYAPGILFLAFLGVCTYLLLFFKTYDDDQYSNQQYFIGKERPDAIEPAILQSLNNRI